MYNLNGKAIQSGTVLHRPCLFLRRLSTSEHSVHFSPLHIAICPSHNQQHYCFQTASTLEPTLVLEAFFDSSKATSQIVSPATKPRCAPALWLFSQSLLSVTCLRVYYGHTATTDTLPMQEGPAPTRTILQTYTPLRADNFVQ